MNNKYLINQVAKISGVTSRTLRHYDSVGLLKPVRTEDSKYRVYSEDDISKLQQILLYKELGFDLADIAKIVNKPNFNTYEALTKHSQELGMRISRLRNIQLLLEKQIQYFKQGKTMKNEDKFKALTVKQINKHEQMHAAEVKDKYGNSDAYKQSQQKYKGYSNDQKLAIAKAGNQIFSDIADTMHLPPADAAVQKLIAAWQQHITDSFYTCTHEMLQGLGEMYVADKRFTANIDKIKPGLAQYLHNAIAVYVAK